MNEDHSLEPQPTAAPSQPPEECPVATEDEGVLFRINESAYGQYIGLVHWNDTDRWYHGNGKR
jgi:hypothetical protein